MSHDREHEPPRDVGRRLFGDPLIQLVELSLGLRRVVDLARHERAAHFASK